MDMINEIRPFGKGTHHLSVVMTDLMESESLIIALAEEERKRDPNAFAGNEACVYFKMPYVPPYERFGELRKMILRIHENTGLRANFKGALAIEVTEWIGHEHEEYFVVLLKYLYDHRHLWRIATILNSININQASHFLSLCCNYITPRLLTVNVFTEQKNLCALIQRAFSLRDKRILTEAVDLLAISLAKSEIKEARSLSLIERTVEEIISMNEGKKIITSANIRDYLSNPYVSLSLMAGKLLIDERSITHETETVQLRG